MSALLYLPVNVYAGHLQSWTLGSLVTQLFFEGTFYHLWYLPSAILGLWLTSALLRRFSVASCAFIVSLLYLIGLLGDSYFGIISQAPLINDIYSAIFAVMGYTRNGLFFAPIFFLLSTVIRRSKCGSTALLAVGLALSFAMMLAEALLARAQDWQRHDSMYLLLPLSCISCLRCSGVSAAS